MTLIISTTFVETNVILTCQRDWVRWFELTKTIAQAKGIWDYMNPDTAHENKPTLAPPAKPKPEDIDSSAQTPGLSPGDLELYIVLYEGYLIERQDYNQRRESLNMFRAHIQSTISERILSHTFNCDTADGMLVRLRNAFTPTIHRVLVNTRCLHGSGSSNEDLEPCYRGLVTRLEYNIS